MVLFDKLLEDGMTANLGVIVALAASTALQQGAFAGYVAQPPPIGTPCVADDLIGVWSSDLLGRAVTANTAPPILRTEYLRIGRDGAMAYFASTRKPANLREIERRLDGVEEAAGLRLKAKIVSAGVLVVYRDGAPTEGFTCTMIRNTDGAGEVLWTQLKGHRPVLRHNLRLSR